MCTAPTAALGEEQSLLTVREAALHDDASSPIAHPLPSLTSHVATTPVNCSVPIPARPRRSMRSNNSTKQLLSQPPSKGYMNGCVRTNTGIVGIRGPNSVQLVVLLQGDIDYTIFRRVVSLR